MIGTIPDDHSFSTVRKILEVEIEHFTRPQSSMERERVEESGHLLLAHGAWHSLDRLDPHSTPDGPLPTRCSHEGAVPFRDASKCRVLSLLDGVLFVRELVGEDQVLVEG